MNYVVLSWQFSLAGAVSALEYNGFIIHLNLIVGQLILLDNLFEHEFEIAIARMGAAFLFQIFNINSPFPLLSAMLARQFIDPSIQRSPDIRPLAN